ncbi:protein kinase domain-containing protein [Enhygromyxa salina]|uniref:Serine/threonine-protein kinase PknH n=1 Tax=Enhygromyxa salina TaxID=215803 RepID=A0A2S9YV54_9BACT|nr:protein kinase [Enhygromyxa salina]PRQ08966.1 Serine/threonine-protein kinase PknH [Enhygromyxa salina]
MRGHSERAHHPDAEPTRSSAPRLDPAQLWPDDGAPPRLGRYEVLHKIGQGSHGVVFAGYDTQLQRPVALKVFADDRPEREVQREAVAMSASRDVHVVALHDLDRVHGLSFLVMELINGPNVWQYMCSPGNDWRRAVLLFIQAAHGLAAVHRAGFAHGDVKPSNLLIGRNDHVYVADFSIAEARELHPTAGAGEHVGSRDYQAPERLRGASANERTDQFSLCVSLWQTVFSCLPWASNDAQIMRARAPVKLRRCVGSPRQLERVLMRGLAVEPGDRFSSMDELAAALTDLVIGRLERGQFSPTLRTVKKLALGLGMRISGRAGRQTALAELDAKDVPTPVPGARLGVIDVHEPAT